MPTLKQLTCQIERGPLNLPLREYNTKYADGFVETHIIVPTQPSPFSVHLTSDGYIAPGLAMFVYIDGVPQCNRNRRGLIAPTMDSKLLETNIDFRVRQKEDKVSDGKYIGREWSFEALNTGTYYYTYHA